MVLQLTLMISALSLHQARWCPITKCQHLACPDNYDPVCGSDGNFYANQCYLKLENCRICGHKTIYSVDGNQCHTRDHKHKAGKCPIPECQHLVCQDNYEPVCGSDGHRYHNKCYMKRENCRICWQDKIYQVKDQLCHTTSSTTAAPKAVPETTTPQHCIYINCSFSFEPVCGSDGMTYSNDYVLGAENCKRDPDDKITIEHEGFCVPGHTESTTTTKPKTTTPRNCDNIPCKLIFKPVCGSDGMTYSNDCVLGVENCKRDPDDKITIEHEGFCVPGHTESTTTTKPETTTPRNCDNIPCRLIFKPVCGSDGMTYSNDCVLGVENCKRDPDDKITMEHEGFCFPGHTESTTTTKPETTTPRNCDNIPCRLIFKPVCGSDGMTYSSDCVLGVENCKRDPDDMITIEHEGFCVPGHTESTTTTKPETTTPRNCDNIPCKLIFKPVCGSDGMTYSNDCVLGVENCKRGPDDKITIEHEGFCVPGHTESTTTTKPETTTPRNCDNIPCKLIFKPVCGSDGMTYSNDCVLGVENCKRDPDDKITIEHEGFCFPGHTESTTTTKPETTTPRNCDNIPCRLIFKPVCGSDGMTYSNDCVLGVENCKRGPDDKITIEHEGFCVPGHTESTTTTKPKTTTPRNCDNIPCRLIFEPVCGSDGMTYSNDCVLGVENCKRDPDDKITIEHEGFCVPGHTESTTTAEPTTTTPRKCNNINCACQQVFSPVCGSDRVTYSNKCVMEAENCKRGPHDKITIKHEGICSPSQPETTTTEKPETTPPPRNCDKIPYLIIFKPVCGSDGVTYINDCVLEAVNGKRGPQDKITIEHEGICSTGQAKTKPETTTPRNCDNIECRLSYEPVCGSDGMTYSNDCVLGVENCKRGPDDMITIEHEGRCSGKLPGVTKPAHNCSATCLAVYDPVCGSDGETYPNSCELYKENCNRYPGYKISVKYQGLCATYTSCKPHC